MCVCMCVWMGGYFLGGGSRGLGLNVTNIVCPKPKPCRYRDYAKHVEGATYHILRDGDGSSALKTLRENCYDVHGDKPGHVMRHVM